uniref:Uncharacterized protein orf64 n=1 Tax=Proteomonas sulcata TaxID=77928 RepID=Q075N0_9CRYP|nr:hypothetical protein [Proteomonas sulcata]
MYAQFFTRRRLAIWAPGRGRVGTGCQRGVVLGTRARIEDSLAKASAGGGFTEPRDLPKTTPLYT